MSNELTDLISRLESCCNYETVGIGERWAKVDIYDLKQLVDWAKFLSSVLKQGV